MAKGDSLVPPSLTFGVVALCSSGKVDGKHHLTRPVRESSGHDQLRRGWRTILKLTCWLCGTHPSTFGVPRARTWREMLTKAGNTMKCEESPVSDETRGLTRRMICAHHIISENVFKGQSTHNPANFFFTVPCYKIKLTGLWVNCL